MTMKDLELQLQERRTFLQKLFEAHEPILMKAVLRMGFRYHMPSGGPDAIAAGLVSESDKFWEMSDDHSARNGFNLTSLGREVVFAQGWICTCAGCLSSWIDGYCSGCQAGINQYGIGEIEGYPACKFHARLYRERS